MTLEKFVKVILLSSIAIIAGFIIYQVFFTRPSPYINFGILNEDGQIGNYPKNVSKGEAVYLRYYIGNHHPDISEFSVRTYLANKSSTVTFEGGVENATLLGVYNRTLSYNETHTSDPLSFTIDEVGENYRICFELWVFNYTRWNYVDKSVKYIWINCTL